MRGFVNRLKDGDRKLLYFFNQKIKCTILDKWMPRITHLGGASFTVGLFIVLFFLIHSKRFIVEGLISLTLSHLLVQIIKRGFSRPRPYIMDSEVKVFPNPLKDYSFPSGHTTAIFSLTTTISIAIPWLGNILYIIAFIVGLSRVYLGLHYPVDVGFGALIGLLFAMSVHFYF